MDQRIVQYFKLCAVINPRVHPVANLIEINNIIPDKDTYFMNIGGKLVPRETIIGGRGESRGESMDIINNYISPSNITTRKPIIVI